MNESRKVQSHHLDRDAYLYVRQSSMKQVIENTESTKRQYALRARATALGGADDRIVVNDSDQGESGASAAWREGFRQLVTDVGLGRAGIVMGLEVSSPGVVRVGRIGGSRFSTAHHRAAAGMRRALWPMAGASRARCTRGTLS